MPWYPGYAFCLCAAFHVLKAHRFFLWKSTFFFFHTSNEYIKIDSSFGSQKDFPAKVPKMT